MFDTLKIVRKLFKHTGCDDAAIAMSYDIYIEQLHSACDNSVAYILKLNENETERIFKSLISSSIDCIKVAI